MAKNCYVTCMYLHDMASPLFFLISSERTSLPAVATPRYYILACLALQGKLKKNIIIPIPESLASF
jgi:hypothetical protein